MIGMTLDVMGIGRGEKGISAWGEVAWRGQGRQRPIPTNDRLLGQDIDRGSNEGGN